MASNFPASLDPLQPLISDVRLVNSANNQNELLTTLVQATVALETAVGATNSADPNSLTYQVANLPNEQWKAAVVCATTANIALTGEQTIDGVLTAASRVLVKNQSTASQNGPYLSGPGAWTRTVDANTSAEVQDMTCFVARGTTQADTAWHCTTDSIVLGTTALTFVQTAGIGTITAGESITVTGNSIAVTRPMTTGTTTGRTLPDHFSDAWSVKDFGAKGDGSTDDTAAFTAARAAAAAVPRVLDIPSGVYAGVGITSYGESSETAFRANAEQFRAQSGENIYVQSNKVTEYTNAPQRGTTFNQTTTFVAMPFVASASITFIQGVTFRMKKSGAMAAGNGNRIDVFLYDNSGPGGLPGAIVTGSGGGHIYTDSVGSSFADVNVLLQNVTVSLTPGATYYVLLQHSETGGTFDFDSAAATAKMYSGATLAGMTDTGSVVEFTVQARTAYGVHSYAPMSHGMWTISDCGVGIRVDVDGHIGVYSNAVRDNAFVGLSTHGYGGKFTSTYANGAYVASAALNQYALYAQQTGASGNFPAIFGDSVSGPGIGGSTLSASNAPRLIGIRSYSQGIAYGTQGNIIIDVSAVPASAAWTIGDMVVDKAKAVARGGPALWKCVVTGTPGIWAVVNLDGISADQGDADITATYGAIASTILYATALTTNRTITLSTTGATNGAKFRVTRAVAATGASTLSVGGLKLLALGTWADVMFDGAAWVLVATGTL